MTQRCSAKDYFKMVLQCFNFRHIFVIVPVRKMQKYIKNVSIQFFRQKEKLG